MAFRSAIPLHMIEPIQRDVQRVAAGEFQNQIIAVEVLHREAFEALIFGDAMLDMDDIVAHVEIFQRGEERCGLTLGLRLVAGALGKQFFFRQNGQAQVRCEESRGQIAVQDIKRRFAFYCRSGPGLHVVHSIAGTSCSRKSASKRSTWPRLLATSTTRHSSRRRSMMARVWLKGVPRAPSRRWPGSERERPGPVPTSPRLLPAAQAPVGCISRAVHEFLPGQKQPFG